jgi:hypothetical protein
VRSFVAIVVCLGVRDRAVLGSVVELSLLYSMAASVAEPLVTNPPKS